MNKPYLKTNNDVIRYYFIYIIALLPLIIYGIFTNNFISFVFLGITLLMGNIIDITICYFKKEKLNNNDLLKNNLIYLLISLLTPTNINIFVYIGIFIITYSILKILNKKYFVIMPIILILIYEIILKTKLDSNMILTFINYFLGYQNSHLFISSIFLNIVGLVILSTTNIYKKEIAIISSSLYLLFLFLTGIIFNNLDFYFNNYYISYNLFIFFFIAPFNYNSCYTKTGKILSSIIIAVISFISTIFNIFYGSLIAIFIINLMHNIIDNNAIKWDFKAKSVKF